MSFFDDVRAKVDEFLGGGVEEVTSQAEDVDQQVQDAKESLLPEEDQESNESSDTLGN